MLLVWKRSSSQDMMVAPTPSATCQHLHKSLGLRKLELDVQSFGTDKEPLILDVVFFAALQSEHILRKPAACVPPRQGYFLGKSS